MGKSYGSAEYDQSTLYETQPQNRPSSLVEILSQVYICPPCLPSPRDSWFWMLTVLKLLCCFLCSLLLLVFMKLLLSPICSFVLCRPSLQIHNSCLLLTKSLLSHPSLDYFSKINTCYDTSCGLFSCEKLALFYSGTFPKTLCLLNTHYQNHSIESIAVYILYLMTLCSLKKRLDFIVFYPITSCMLNLNP